MPKQAKAKTAYELLERVCQHIQEEPRRYDQRTWMRRGRKALVDIYGSDKVPACGTVCCIAGWVVALNDGVQRAQQVSTWGRASALLGFEQPQQTGNLFAATAVQGRHGSAAYVKRGVAHIRAFMKAHEAHLKARVLKGV